MITDLSGWCETFALFPKTSVDGNKIQGTIMRRPLEAGGFEYRRMTGQEASDFAKGGGR